jgi:hypothetical protein
MTHFEKEVELLNVVENNMHRPEMCASCSAAHIMLCVCVRPARDVVRAFPPSNRPAAQHSRMHRRVAQRVRCARRTAAIACCSFCTDLVAIFQRKLEMATETHRVMQAFVQQLQDA